MSLRSDGNVSPYEVGDFIKKVQNYIMQTPSSFQCLTHTHQIGMDMQLYVATLPLMLVIWKYSTLGWSLLALMAVASTALRYLAIYWYDISMFVYYGIS